MSGVAAAMMTGGGFGTLVLDISNTASPDIPALLSAAGWIGTAQPVRLENSALVNTLVIPSALSGADIYLLNDTGARIGGVKNGGTALRTQVAIKIENKGTISGGGGRGGNGGGASATWGTGYFGGVGGSSGGDGEGFANSSTLAISAAVAGQPSTNTVVYGPWPTDGCTVYGGKGGDGGAWGGWGGNGNNGLVVVDPGSSQPTISTSQGVPGALAGYYIDGNDLVTWIATGTRLGRVKA